MKTICPACDPPTNWESEEEYKDHLVTFHGTNSADEAMKLARLKKENLPVELPPGIPPEAAPTPEFAQMMNMVEKGKQVSQVTPPPSAPIPPKIEIKPLVLKYKFEGDCPDCKNPIRTIVSDFEGKLVANAYCLNCDEVKLQIPVELIKQSERGGKK